MTELLFSLPKYLANLIDVTSMTLLRSLSSKQMLLHNNSMIRKEQNDKVFPICHSLVTLSPARFSLSLFSKGLYPVHPHYQSIPQCPSLDFCPNCEYSNCSFKNDQYLLEKAVLCCSKSLQLCFTLL